MTPAVLQVRWWTNGWNIQGIKKVTPDFWNKNKKRMTHFLPAVHELNFAHSSSYFSESQFAPSHTVLSSIYAAMAFCLNTAGNVCCQILLHEQWECYWSKKTAVWRKPDSRSSRPQHEVFNAKSWGGRTSFSWNRVLLKPFFALCGIV